MTIEVDPEVIQLTVVPQPMMVTASSTRPILNLVSLPSAQIQVQTQPVTVSVTAPGPQGPPGATGPPGPPGSFYYRHDQLSGSASWIVNHNLGAIPNTTVVVSSEVVHADVTHGSLNQTTITFPAPVNGVAIFS